MLLLHVACRCCCFAADATSAASTAFIAAAVVLLADFMGLQSHQLEALRLLALGLFWTTPCRRLNRLDLEGCGGTKNRQLMLCWMLSSNRRHGSLTDDLVQGLVGQDTQGMFYALLPVLPEQGEEVPRPAASQGLTICTRAARAHAGKEGSQGYDASK